MLTPRFKLKQDDRFVYINIYAPYSNIKDSECLIEDYDFIFFANPYFLRVRLPGKLRDSDLCSGTFDANDQSYSLQIEKEVHGEFFNNLDTITNLLIPCSPEKSKFVNKIEVLSSEINDNESEIVENDKNLQLDSFNRGFGFGNKITSKFNSFETFLEVFDLSPEIVVTDRKSQLYNIENKAFSSDHYLADLYDSENIDEILKFVGPWNEHAKTGYVHKLSDSEIDLLKELPNKEFILSENEKRQILIGVLDIVYPYMYESRTTGNDLNSESSWTVNKISSTLSGFIMFCDIEDCVVSLFRRSLIYPLYRNYNLCLAVLNDLKIILSLGKKYIIKTFIDIHLLFNLSQASRYILNDLYIKDYLIFLQKIDESDIEWLKSELNKLNISKDKLSLELVELEEAAEIVKNENAKDYEDIAHLMKKCANLTVDTTDSDDSSDESSSGESDDSSDSDSSCDQIDKNDKGQLYVNMQAA